MGIHTNVKEELFKNDKKSKKQKQKLWFDVVVPILPDTLQDGFMFTDRFHSPIRCSFKPMFIGFDLFYLINYN